MGWPEALYRLMPVWGQHAAVSAYGLHWKRLRFGPGYPEAVEEFMHRERWPQQELEVFCRERLRDLLREAESSIPYYSENWSEEAKRSAREGRLEGLPLLEKAPIRHNPAGFSRGMPRPRGLQVFQTSGSTGTPLDTFWTPHEYRVALALREARSARWAGASFGMPRATFSGRRVVPSAESPPPYHRYNAAERQVYFSAFHLSANTVRSYVVALENHGVKWITGYAGSCATLSRLVLEQGLKAPRLEAIVTTSEKVTPEMRQLMQRAFSCKVFEEYSTVDNAVFASECEMGTLHVSTDAGVVEILRPDGSPCGPGEVGEVVATSFIRRYQPFIRFRIGDLAAWSARSCGCGRSLPALEEVVGRIEDVVVGPDGREMVRFHGVFVGLPHVAEGQIVQRALNQIVVKVVPSAGFSQTEEKVIVQRVKDRLGSAVQVEVVRVEALERTTAGKAKAVISELNWPSKKDSGNQGVA